MIVHSLLLLKKTKAHPKQRNTGEESSLWYWSWEWLYVRWSIFGGQTLV